MSIIADAIDRIQKLATDGQVPSDKTLAGRLFLFQPSDDHYEEVIPRIPKPRSADLGTVAALAAWLKRYGAADKSFVTVSPKAGITARLDTTVLDFQVEEVSVPFFADDQPPDSWLGYAEMIQYPDAHQGHVQEEELLRKAIASIKVFRAREAVLTNKGAFVNIEMKDSSGAHTDIDIPTFIGVDLRVLTREYRERHRFRLDLALEGVAPRFRFIPCDREEAVVRAVGRALADLRTQLGDDWLLVEGA